MVKKLKKEFMFSAKAGTKHIYALSVNNDPNIYANNKKYMKKCKMSSSDNVAFLKGAQA